MEIFNIKKIQKSSLHQFVNLWNQGKDVLTSSGFLMTQEKAEKGFKEKMFDYFGLFEKENLVGFMLLKKEKNDLWIKHLLVDKAFRRKGWGKRLIDKAFSIAKKNKMKIKTEVLIKKQKRFDVF
jgi:ribosomal protein S18 acetylase RimI-like enzyme